MLHGLRNEFGKGLSHEDVTTVAIQTEFSVHLSANVFLVNTHKSKIFFTYMTEFLNPFIHFLCLLIIIWLLGSQWHALPTGLSEPGSLK